MFAQASNQPIRSSLLALNQWHVVVLLLPVAVLCFVAFAAPWSHVASVACAVAAIPSAAMLMCWLGQEDALNPCLAILVSILFGTSLRSMYRVIDRSQASAIYLDGLGAEGILLGAGIVTLATFFWIAGYLVAARWTPQIKMLDRLGSIVSIDRSRLMMLSCFCGAASLVVAFDFLRRTGFSLDALSLDNLSAKRRVAVDGSGQHVAAMGYHLWIAGTLPMVLFLYWLRESMMTKKRAAVVAAVFFFSLSSLFAFLVSSRTTICINIVMGLFLMSRYSRLTIGKSLVAGICVLIVISVMLSLRSGRSRTQGLAAALGGSALLDATVGSENFLDVGRVAKIHEAVPDGLQYKYGTSYLLWTIAPMPRVLWPGKPAISQGLEIAEKVYHGKRLKKGVVGGGRPPGYVGEAVMNFGLLGVPVIAALYGIVVRLFQNWYQNLSRNSCLNVAAAYLFMPLCFSYCGGEFSRVLMLALQGLIPILAILVFVGLTSDVRATAVAAK